MSSIAIPLQITKKGFLRYEKVQQSIDSTISLLLQTALYSCAADPQFGFVFTGLRFEIFNENEGTVYNASEDNNEISDLVYKKKISGTSKNISTFAADLKEAIIKYEPRLSDINTTMTYIREERIIYVSVKGVITETGEDYQYQTTIRIWN